MTKNRIIRFYHYLYYRSYYHYWFSPQKDQEKMDSVVLGASKFSLIITAHFFILSAIFDTYYRYHFGYNYFNEYFIGIICVTSYIINGFLYIKGNKCKEIIDYFDNELNETSEIRAKKNKNLNNYFGFLAIVTLILSIIRLIILK